MLSRIHTKPDKLDLNGDYGHERSAFVPKQSTPNLRQYMKEFSRPILFGFFSRIPEDCARLLCVHYSGVIMGAMASQITSLTIVYSTVYSGADQRKHQSSASSAFVRGIHRWPVNSPHKWPVTWEMFPLDDIIMIRNCFDIIVLWLLRSMFAGTFPLLVWCRHFSKIKSIGRQHAAVLTIQSTQIDTTSGNWRTSSCGLSTPPRMRPGWTSIRWQIRVHWCPDRIDGVFVI